jgi:preprotein translocase subunit SecE
MRRFRRGAAPRPPRGRAVTEFAGNRARGSERVARTSPGEFLRQVRAETAKVVWPTRKETVTTAIMVVIMTTLLGLFFFATDSAFSAIVKALLGLLG